MTGLAEYQNMPQHPGKKTFICFNPHCKQPRSRVLSNINDHCFNDKCKKWIIPTVLSNSYRHKQLEKQSARMFQIPFGDQPMQCILNSSKLKSISLQKLSQCLDSLAKIMSESLKSIWQVIKLKIDVSFQPFEQVGEQLKQIMNQYSLQKINTFVLSPQMKQILHRQNMVVLSQLEVQGKIKSSIEEITENIFCTKEDRMPDIGMSVENTKNFQKYLRDSADDHPKKLTKIASLLKIEQKNLYERKSHNFRANNCSNVQNQYILKCPICMQTFLTEKKKQLMINWNFFTDHLYNAHSEELGYCYEHLISFRGPLCTSVQQIIYKLINYEYQALEFICRNGKKNYNFHYSNRKKFSVEIVGKGESAQFPIKCLYVNQFNDFYCYLCVIAYNLHSNKRSKGKPIYIYNSNQLQMNSILRMNDFFDMKSLHIVMEKRKREIDDENI